MGANKTAGEEARRLLHKNAASNIEQVLVAIPHKAPTIRPPASHHENYGGARGVVVITVGNEHGYTSSNPGRY